MTGAPKDPAEQFRDLLDQHGHGFQWSVASHLKELSERRAIPWAVDGEEVPVVVRNKTTKIDIVLRRRGQEQVRMYLVCECKRTNPAFWWCFIRRSRGQLRPLPGYRTVVADRLHALPIQPIGVKQREVCCVPVRSEENVFDLALPLRTDVKGDSRGEGRELIDNALDQVTIALGGLIEMVSARPSLLPAAASGGQADFVPLIVTTARLFATGTPLDDADVYTGELPKGMQLEELNWLWLEYQVSPGLKHTLPMRPDPGGTLASIAEYVASENTRHVGIATPKGLVEFLKRL